MIRIEQTSPTNYTGYKKPEKISVNSKLDLVIYYPEKNLKPFVALVRKFEYEITEPVLLTVETLNKINKILKTKNLLKG
jgi:hypothetical protein